MFENSPGPCGGDGEVGRERESWGAKVITKSLSIPHNKLEIVFREWWGGVKINCNEITVAILVPQSIPQQLFIYFFFLKNIFF